MKGTTESAVARNEKWGVFVVNKEVWSICKASMHKLVEKERLKVPKRKK